MFTKSKIIIVLREKDSGKMKHEERDGYNFEYTFKDIGVKETFNVHKTTSGKQWQVSDPISGSSLGISYKTRKKAVTECIERLDNLSYETFEKARKISMDIQKERGFE